MYLKFHYIMNITDIHDSNASDQNTNDNAYNITLIKK